MFVPAAPGFKIQWVDENEVIQETADLVGWLMDENEPLDARPVYWQGDDRLCMAYSNSRGYVEVVAK